MYGAWTWVWGAYVFLCVCVSPARTRNALNTPTPPQYEPTQTMDPPKQAAAQWEKYNVLELRGATLGIIGCVAKNTTHIYINGLYMIYTKAWSQPPPPKKKQPDQPSGKPKHMYANTNPTKRRYGDIGQACARLAKAFGMKILALKRRPPGRKGREQMGLV